MSRRPAIDRERVDASVRVPPWVRHEHEARYRFAARLCHGVVVDCACGDGAGTAHFAAPAERVLAFDADPAAVERTAARGLPNVEAAVADATALPVPDGHADVIVSLETIEHVDDDHGFVAEMARIARPGGLFVCSTPNRRVTNPGSTIDERPFNPFHVREYDVGEFTALLGQHFEVVDVLAQNPRRAGRVALMESAARATRPILAARANQALKLPRLLFDRAEAHRVQPVDDLRAAEYLVAVCRAR